MIEKVKGHRLKTANIKNDRSRHAIENESILGRRMDNKVEKHKRLSKMIVDLEKYDL